MDQPGPHASVRPPRPGFSRAAPRVLVLTSQYFLCGEVVAALKRLGVPHLFLSMEGKSAELDAFLSALGRAVTSFRPDFVLTVNHLGVDHEGVLVAILERLGLPLASWFVDNPRLVLPLYREPKTSRTAIFTWDADNLDDLREMGFSPVFYLPLAADPERFRVPRTQCPEAWKADISFVGNSMTYKVGMRLKEARPPRSLALACRSLAAAFGASSERSVARFLEKEHPEHFASFMALPGVGRKLAFETYITWESTRQYRKGCLERILPFSPLIAGDKGWKVQFRGRSGWRSLPELSYYEDLPLFYPRQKINFNCTSLQMKGAVNQRVFDVPMAGAFLLTDHRRQMEDLFEPGREVVCYHDPEEVPDLVARYLADTPARLKVALAARARVLAEHTYDRRMSQLLAAMRQSFL